MKELVYIETTIVSYLTARPTRDMVIAAHQELTRQWWNSRASAFDLLVSELVREEAAMGDPEAAKNRLDIIDQIPILKVTNTAVELANHLVSVGLVPTGSAADALHIAITAVNGVNYLLTWNCKHLANAILRFRIEEMVEGSGFNCPIICTPEELMEE
ncbi:MAG TPA: DNA-binding protein [Proteobacteria bacterium]|nr:DNA-binding protein [Pseudomonadota bacterium]